MGKEVPFTWLNKHFESFFDKISVSARDFE